MERFITVVERTAGVFLGLVALLTFCEAVLRYTISGHIPDGFFFGQMLQGIAICWGIATATYADRHVTVDVITTIVGEKVQHVLNVIAFTLNLIFLAGFGFMINVKVFDTLKGGERSIDSGVPIWIGYAIAALGIVVTVVLAALRWWQVVIERRPLNANPG